MLSSVLQRSGRMGAVLSLDAWLRSLLFALAFVYLGYHTLHGERGLYALVKQSHNQTTLSEKLQDVSAQRQALEWRVSHLRDDSLDVDLLDEQYRRMLGALGADEVMVLQPVR